MSSQRGNIHRARGQKHQNKSAFKNNLHDTSWKRKQINAVVTAGVCQRCKDAIDWKIKYRKYKPLSQPRTCNKCHGKTVKQAYYTICVPCAQAMSVCQKCGDKKEVVLEARKSAAEMASEDAMLQFELKQLTERQRRSFFRLQESGKLTSESASSSQHGGGDGCHDNSDSDDSSVCGDEDECLDTTDEGSSDHGDEGACHGSHDDVCCTVQLDSIQLDKESGECFQTGSDLQRTVGDPALECDQAENSGQDVGHSEGLVVGHDLL